MNSILRTLFGLHIFNDGMRTVIMALLPFIAKDLGMSLTQVGIIGASQGLMAIFTALPGGLFASRIGGIRTLFLYMAGYTLCFFLIIITPNILLLMLAYYLAAVGFGPFHIVGQALAARSSSKANLGKNMSNFTVIGEAGRVIFPAIALFIASQFGWRVTLFGFTIACIAVFCILAWLWKKRKDKASEAIGMTKVESSREWLKHTLFLIKQKKLIIINAIGFLDNIGGNAIYVFLPFLLLAKGIHTQELALFVGTFFIGTFTGKIVLGRAVDKFGNVPVLFASELLMALFLLLLALSHIYFLYFVLCLFLGIFTRGTTPVIATLFTEVTDSAHYEKVYAVSEIFFGLAASLSAIILGLIADKFGITNAFLFAAGIAGSVIIPILLYKKIR